MPLIKRKSEKAFEHNLKAEMHAGKPQDQALAIAYSVKRKAKKAHGGVIGSGEKELDKQHLNAGGVSGEYHDRPAAAFAKGGESKQMSFSFSSGRKLLRGGEPHEYVEKIGEHHILRDAGGKELAVHQKQFDSELASGHMHPEEESPEFAGHRQKFEARRREVERKRAFGEMEEHEPVEPMSLADHIRKKMAKGGEIEELDEEAHERKGEEPTEVSDDMVDLEENQEEEPVEEELELLNEAAAHEPQADLSELEDRNHSIVKQIRHKMKIKSRMGKAIK